MWNNGRYTSQNDLFCILVWLGRHSMRLVIQYYIDILLPLLLQYPFPFLFGYNVFVCFLAVVVWPTVTEVGCTSSISNFVNTSGTYRSLTEKDTHPGQCAYDCYTAYTRPYSTLIRVHPSLSTFRCACLTNDSVRDTVNHFNFRWIQILVKVFHRPFRVIINSVDLASRKPLVASVLSYFLSIFRWYLI